MRLRLEPAMEAIQETGELPAGAVTTSVISTAIWQVAENVLGVLRRRSERRPEFTEGTNGGDSISLMLFRSC
jgi:hypothetical protein